MIRALRFSVRTVAPILLGTAVYAFGLQYFVIPNELMEGGVTGIALHMNYSLGWPVSLTTFILNVILLVVGWKAIGRKATYYTLIGTVSLSFFLRVMEVAVERGWIVPFYARQDYLLAALYAGVTIGAGLGVVFRFGGTTGGTDIVATLAYKRKGWSMGRVILLIDAIVIGSALFYIPKEKVLYTLVAVFIASRVIDFIAEGAYSVKAFMIVSDKAADIADAITKELDRGVTLFEAKGAYSKAPKQVVYSVVSRHQSGTLRAVVRSIDPRAFIVISDVHDVLGEGFRSE